MADLVLQEQMSFRVRVRALTLLTVQYDIVYIIICLYQYLCRANLWSDKHIAWFLVLFGGLHANL